MSFPRSHRTFINIHFDFIEVVGRSTSAVVLNELEACVTFIAKVKAVQAVDISIFAALTKKSQRFFNLEL